MGKIIQIDCWASEKGTGGPEIVICRESPKTHYGVDLRRYTAAEESMQRLAQSVQRRVDFKVYPLSSAGDPMGWQAFREGYNGNRPGVREAVAFAAWCHLWADGGEIEGAGHIEEMRKKWFGYFRPYRYKTCWGAVPITCPHCIAQDVYELADAMLVEYRRAL
jgi:hypothetical protein